jgi:hypothetical protein
LAGVALPIPVTVALPPPEDRALSDVWSALGGELKPSLDLVVVSPFEAGPVDEAAKLVREGLRVNVAMSDHDGDATALAHRTSKTRASKAGRAQKAGVWAGEAGAASKETTVQEATAKEATAKEATAKESTAKEATAKEATGAETVVGGTREEKGRIFRLRDMTRLIRADEGGTDGGAD